MKKFLITIDTEGDNLWRWKPGTPITTENTKYLARFQNICNAYGFKPVWLTNYEMIQDDAFVEFIKEVENSHTGELGLHLHAWNTPPIFDLPKIQSGLPYLIEYPDDVMRRKFEFLNNLIVKRTGIQPVSHRAGRWAMDDRYFKILKDFGYRVDCSVTPHINWQSSPGQTAMNGTDYTSYPETPYWIDADKTLLEVPVTVKKTHKLLLPNKFTLRGLARSGYRMLKGEELWLRPNSNNDSGLVSLINTISKSSSDYIMFMLHSSELMPGGSPTFTTEHSIDELYDTLNRLFDLASSEFEGMTLKQYYDTKIQK